MKLINLVWKEVLEEKLKELSREYLDSVIDIENLPGTIEHTKSYLGNSKTEDQSLKQHIHSLEETLKINKTWIKVKENNILFIKKELWI